MGGRSAARIALLFILAAVLGGHELPGKSSVVRIPAKP